MTDRLTRKEVAVFSNYWQSPLRQKNGNVELKKGDCWGVLCSIQEAKKNAQLLIEKEKEQKEKSVKCFVQ